MTRPRLCIYGSIPGDHSPRCDRPAADGFDYCTAHGFDLGSWIMQLPPGDERKAVMMADHGKRVQRCRST